MGVERRMESLLLVGSFDLRKESGSRWQRTERNSAAPEFGIGVNEAALMCPGGDVAAKFRC